MTRSTGGLLLALLSAAGFGASGAIAKGLLASGWSPAAAVTWRVSLSALVLLIPMVLTMRGRWRLLRRGWPTVLIFGLVVVAVCQFAYYQAVEVLSVGVALLLEYLGVVLVVGWHWLRHGQRPKPLTILGCALAVLGLVFVLDAFGGIHLAGRGVLWGLVGAVGLATYFVVSADDRTGLPPIAVAAGGLLVGTAGLHLVGALGLTRLTVSTGAVPLAGHLVPWWFALVTLAVWCTAIPYAVGVTAIRRLGSTVASFVGLTEVLFAVLVAWLLLAELPASVQLLGGVLIVAGVVAVKLGERPGPVVPAATTEDSADGVPGQRGGQVVVAYELPAEAAGAV